MTVNRPLKLYSRRDLADLLVGYNHGSKAQMREIVNDLFGVMAGLLRRGHVIRINEFGRFEPIDTPARLGRNPKTHEAVPIPAGRKVKFQPSKHLKHLLGQEGPEESA